MSVTPTVDDVFRDYNTPGVPSSGNHKPSKKDIRRVLKSIAGGTAAVGDYRGAWSSATAYLTSDFVQSGGSLWLALRQNTNVTPVEGADWTLLLAGASVADGTITEAKLATATKAKIVAVAANRTALAAMSGTSYLAVDLLEAGRKGLFTWQSGDQSANVTADPAQGVYVAPTSASTGASGAWVRQFDGSVQAEWFGVTSGGSAATNTLAINRAIAVAMRLYRPVELPGLEFDVDAGFGSGIVLKTGLRIFGQGRFKTILNVRNGGDIGQLRNYQAGSAFRRDFNLTGYNEYVQQCTIEKMAIVMNHPLASITNTAIQIAVDFRNVTRSRVTDCWIGNYHPITDAKGSSSSYLVQGYAVVCGNEAGTPPPYAGGEVNEIDHNFIAGAYRAVCIDDNQLNPSSAAYSTRVHDNDIQLAQILVYQASQYGAGNVIRDNVLQACVVRNGNSDTITCGIWIGGYGNLIDEPYGEYGNCTYILKLHTQSKNNRARYSGTCSATGGIVTEGTQRAFVDAAGGLSKNIVEFFADTGVFGANGHDSFGNPIRMVSGTRTTVT